MATMLFDPFRAQARHARRNRCSRLRREPAQTAVHGAALLALALLLAVPAWQTRASWGGAVAGLLQQWPAMVWLVAVAAMTGSCFATWRALRATARCDWLAALPVAPSMRRRCVRDALLRQAVGFAVLGSGVLFAAQAQAKALVLLGLAIVAALMLAACATALSNWRDASRGGASSSIAAARGITRTQAVRTGLAVAPDASHGERGDGRRETWSSVVADQGTGRLWRWQRVACGVALHGRTLAWGGLAWLAVPMGSGLGTAFVAGVAGISLALLAGAWRRSLAVLPQAQRWLAAQPLTPARLLRATWAVPAFVLTLAVAAIVGVLLILGAPGLALFAALAMSAFGMLQFAATAAQRRDPARIALAFAVHAVLLVGVLQAFPIAAAPLWVMQMILLLRRALR